MEVINLCLYISMAKLGIVTDEQFNSELENSQAKFVNKTPFVIDAEVLNKTDRGRGTGNNEVPEGLRKIIGEESVINGRKAALDLAEDFGISPSSVSAYAKGATSTATINKPDSNLRNYLTNRKNKASKKALRALHSTLDQITPDKLEGVKPRDLAAIAKDMSVIAKNMEPENAGSNESGKPQFVVYSPTIRDERTYQTVVVNDNY